MNRINQIHEQALLIAKRYKSCETELIEILQVVGEHRVFYHYKFNSPFQYAVQALGLSEEVAYVFIGVSRKASEVPKLKDEIQSGRITVSKAKAISSVLTKENQERWLEIARTKTKRQIEREVAMASAQHAVREQTKFVLQPIEDSAKILNLEEPYIELKIGVPEKLMLKLRQAQDLVSQSKQRHVNLTETLEAMIDLFIQKKDPLEKAKRQKIRGKLDADVKTLVPGPAKVDIASRTQRAPLPAAVKHQLYLKHQGQCSYMLKNGDRCQQKRMLEVHHIVPIAMGGPNDLSNLTLLCQGHHRVHHVSQIEMTSSF